MPSPVADLLGDLAAGLDRLGIPWYLFGARAAILYGVARLTADVDVTVRLPEGTSSSSLVAVLAAHGFRPRVPDPEFIERTRVIPFVHAATALPLDLVLAGPGLEDRFFDRAVSRTIAGARVPVASAEDIIVMKVLAGRPKDTADITAIAAANWERLDFRYVRRTLELVEQALSQDDLMPALKRALAVANRARPRQSSTKRRRSARSRRR
jgi:hypothetical protein